MPQFNLTVLVRDLLNEHEVRAAFNRNPEAVMKEYGLSDDERMILYSLDETVIAPEVFPPVDAQIGNYYNGNEEFHPAGADFVPEPGVTLPAYPTPKPALFRVRPRRVTPDDIITVTSNAGVQTKFIEIKVFGQSFSRMPVPDVSIVNQNPPNAALAVERVRVFGTMRSSELYVLIRVQGTASEMWTYDVTVTNCPTTTHPYPVQNKVTLQLEQ